MHETSVQGWGTRKTQRDGMGREVGGGFRMGNTCKSMVDSYQCMAKTTTNIVKKKKKPNSSTRFDIYYSSRVCSMVVLVEISQKSKLKQLTMVRNSE